MQYRHPHLSHLRYSCASWHQMVILESKCFQGSTVTSFLIIQYWLCISSILLVTVPNMVHWLWTVSSFLPSGYGSKPLQIVEHPENSRLSTCLHTFRDFEPCFEPYFGRQSWWWHRLYLQNAHDTDESWCWMICPILSYVYIYIYTLNHWLYIYT